MHASVLSQRRLGNDGSDLFDIGRLRRGLFLPSLLSVRIGCAPMCSSHPRRPLDQFVVHLPDRTRLLLDITTDGVGQSVVLYSSDRGPVLAQVEAQNC